MRAITMSLWQTVYSQLHGLQLRPEFRKFFFRCSRDFMIYLISREAGLFAVECYLAIPYLSPNENNRTKPESSADI